MKTTNTTLALILAVSTAPVMAQTTDGVVEEVDRAGVNLGTVSVGEIVSIPDWHVEALYPNGFSAEEMIDEVEVFGLDGEEIGDVEDIVIGPDGRVISVIAEVGGFWDIGDTHVSIPWSDVEITAAGIAVPVTEDTVEDFSLFGERAATAAVLSEEITAGLDDVELGPRAWRVTELIGDYARLRTDSAYQNYGYVSDVVIRDGQVVAAVVSPDAGYGVPGRRYPYPYYGFGYAWNPGMQTYDLPYTEDEVRDVEPLDYDRFGVE